MSERQVKRQPSRAVASTRHTLVLLLAIVLLGLSAIRNPISEWPKALVTEQARVLLYVRIVVLQWLGVGYVWLGLWRSRTTLRKLIDDSEWTALRWLRYLAVGVAGWVAYLVIGSGLSGVFHPGPEALVGLQAMLPQTPLERMVWAAFALTAGVCEEVVYRGYLMRQFHALTGNSLAALVLQAVCYTLVHLALPVPMLAGVVVLGLLLGGLAVWQKSLVPGMILHVGVGLVAMIRPG